MEVKILKAYEKGMVPANDDFVVKNGSKCPNSSKNIKRLPTTI
jgi:hypothetical protein